MTGQLLGIIGNAGKQSAAKKGRFSMAHYVRRGHPYFFAAERELRMANESNEQTQGQ